MVKELFEIGDVLFYDKINEGISNLSSEDADTQIYFDYKQYVALGVVTDVSDIESTITLMTPNFNQFYINGIQNSDETVIIDKIKELIKNTNKAFVKECGKQESVKMFVPNEQDIKKILDNAKMIASGFQTLYYFCKKLINDTNTDVIEILTDRNLAYIEKKKLNLLLGGIGPDIYAKDFNELSRQQKENFENSSSVKIIRDNMPVDEFINSENRAEIIEYTEEDNKDKESEEIVEEKEYCGLFMSLDDIKEKYPKADIVMFYAFPMMKIRID